MELVIRPKYNPEYDPEKNEYYDKNLSKTKTLYLLYIYILYIIYIYYLFFHI